MYLKELDLQGFKSFPEKVKLEFNKGITAVVGPNGSGKSNISDAVRWVLGEQRPKSLRGGKMEDVIFAGTANRRQVGFAEVSMTVDNSDKVIPVEYSEIKITRRVYRSGESNYFINGTECRLKDIYELFMDTGIGRDGYSIIGQGKIDEILSNKSEDRRQLFEEAAGIVKYKNRKSEAENKLDKERQNLVRITDIISEIESKIEPLEKQAEKAKKYLELYGEMKEADIRLFCINGKKLEKETEELKSLVENAVRDIDESENSLSLFKSEAEKIKESAEILTASMEEINRVVASLSGEIEKNEGVCRLTEEQIRNLRESVKRLEGEKESRSTKISANTEEILVCREAAENAAGEIERMRALLAEKEEALNAMLERQSEHEQKIENYKSEMIEKIKLTADIKSSAERTEAVLEQFNARLKQISEEKSELEKRLKDRKIAGKSAEIRAEQSTDTVEEINREIEKLENKKAGIMKIIAVIKEGFDDKSRRLAEKQSRLKVLNDMEKEHDGYYKSVKAVLQLKDKGNPSFKGIRGAVAQIFKADEKYELAVETALGGSLQSLVVENEADAKNAVNYLKSNQLGRATFLPMSTVKGRALGTEKDSLLKEKGVIASAVDLIKCDREYMGIAESLLGRIIVIDTIDNAIAFAKKFKQSYRLVTLEGESFMPGGAITGGSTGKKNSGVFGRKREIDSLKAETEALCAACEGLASERDKNRNKADSIDEEIEERREEAREANIGFITAKQELEQVNRDIGDYEEKLRLASIEEKQLNEQIEKADTTAEEITSIKVEISSMNEKKQSQLNNIQRLEAENEQLLSDISKVELEKAEAESQIEDKQKLAEKAAEMTERSRAEKAEKELELSNVTEQRRYENERLIEQENKINDCRETILKYKNELVRLETKSEKISEEKKRLNDDMWENYEITYPEALKYESSDEQAFELSKRARELKSQIKALGSVNVNAVEEYKETKERYEFLSKQKNDIIEAEEKLKEIINDLSGLMERQFREKLEIISENFNEVFREMFGGGRAYLKLSDEEDVLGSGIDIIAQPPGKNLQNMMLLSGGERALTAIAILFSILKMKPSPFCILDEIEAALDDANVQRFGDYLQQFAKGTQFIVITHRKGTMESADVLYGVTMQEQGVSKIVSVKFDEAISQ